MESTATADQNQTPSLRFVNYEEFEKWLREQADLAGRCDNEWSAAFPECQQAIFRRGMWYAFHEATQALGMMSFEPPTSNLPLATK
jgi:hypothetical protein